MPNWELQEHEIVVELHRDYVKLTMGHVRERISVHEVPYTVAQIAAALGYPRPYSAGCHGETTCWHFEAR